MKRNSLSLFQIHSPSNERSKRALLASRPPASETLQIHRCTRGKYEDCLKPLPRQSGGAPGRFSAIRPCINATLPLTRRDLRVVSRPITTATERMLNGAGNKTKISSPVLRATRWVKILPANRPGQHGGAPAPPRRCVSRRIQRRDNDETS